LNQKKREPSNAPSAAAPRAAAEPKYLEIVAEGIRKEAAEVHRTLTTRIVELNLPDLYQFEAKAHFLNLAPALVQGLKDRIATLKHAFESLKQQAWQSIRQGDTSLAVEFLQEARAIKPTDRTLDRALQCVELLIKKRKALVQEILMPDSQKDNASRPPTLDVSQERIIGYIGVLLGFEEESQWRP
jgi:hypothetical protein